MKTILSLSLIFSIVACAQTLPEAYTQKDFNAYWYSGKAEISSYSLNQARYGEIRKGNAVNIFVTEPFSKKSNTKADDYKNPENVTVLKLNATKKFNTGIYPYSIMTSTFLPINVPKASIKISSSTQEWCGHEYLELVHSKNKFILHNNSYFEGRSFQNLSLDHNTILEDDLWSILRIKPSNLPVGQFKALPSFVYLRFGHLTVKPYKAEARLTQTKKNLTYILKYPDLNRSLSITFKKEFPYQIQSWSESYFSGFGKNRQKMTTTATLNKTLNIDYWNTKSNKDLYLRKVLEL